MVNDVKNCFTCKHCDGDWLICVSADSPYCTSSVWENVDDNGEIQGCEAWEKCKRY